MIDYSRATGSAFNVTVGLTSTVVLPPSPNRVGIIFTSSISDDVTYSVLSPAVVGSGLQITISQRPFILTLRDHGQIVQRQWNAIVATVPAIVQIYEFAVSNDVLRQIYNG